MKWVQTDRKQIHAQIGRLCTKQETSVFQQMRLSTAQWIPVRLADAARHTIRFIWFPDAIWFAVDFVILRLMFNAIERLQLWKLSENSESKDAWDYSQWTSSWSEEKNWMNLFTQFRKSSCSLANQLFQKALLSIWSWDLNLKVFFKNQGGRNNFMMSKHLCPELDSNTDQLWPEEHQQIMNTVSDWRIKCEINFKGCDMITFLYSNAWFTDDVTLFSIQSTKKSSQNIHINIIEACE